MSALYCRVLDMASTLFICGLIAPMSSSLTPLFNPCGLVIVDASKWPETLGYGAARNLVYSDYRGAIHFVSKKSGELFNCPLYRNLSLVPDPVDLAVLIVPAPAMSETLEDCGQRGIRTAILVASGFREMEVNPLRVLDKGAGAIDVRWIK